MSTSLRLALLGKKAEVDKLMDRHEQLTTTISDAKAVIVAAGGVV